MPILRSMSASAVAPLVLDRAYAFGAEHLVERGGGLARGAREAAGKINLDMDGTEVGNLVSTATLTDGGGK